jgi:hypothetical protein
VARLLLRDERLGGRDRAGWGWLKRAGFAPAGGRDTITTEPAASADDGRPTVSRKSRSLRRPSLLSTVFGTW